MFLRQFISFYRAFVGMVLSGVLLDTVGFPWCTTRVAIADAAIVSKIVITSIIKCV